jgi:hypothetical protein
LVISISHIIIQKIQIFPRERGTWSDFIFFSYIEFWVQEQDHGGEGGKEEVAAVCQKALSPQVAAVTTLHSLHQHEPTWWCRTRGEKKG